MGRLRLHVFCLLTLVTGCFPVATLRPPSALEGEPDYEVGAGIATLGPRPYVTEPTRFTGQLWGSLQATRWLTLSAVGAFDTEAPAGGVTALVKPLRLDRFVMGGEVELGFAWGAVSVPAAVRLFDNTWLYTSPRLQNWQDKLGGGVPVGASIGIIDPLSIRLEAQLSWAEFVYYNRRLHTGTAIVYHW